MTIIQYLVLIIYVIPGLTIFFTDFDDWLIAIFWPIHFIKYCLKHLYSVLFKDWK